MVALRLHRLKHLKTIQNLPIEREQFYYYLFDCNCFVASILFKTAQSFLFHIEYQNLNILKTTRLGGLSF